MSEISCNPANVLSGEFCFSFNFLGENVKMLSLHQRISSTCAKVLFDFKKSSPIYSEALICFPSASASFSLLKKEKTEHTSLPSLSRCRHWDLAKNSSVTNLKAEMTMKWQKREVKCCRNISWNPVPGCVSCLIGTYYNIVRYVNMQIYGRYRQEIPEIPGLLH